MPTSCALLGGFAIGARVALLWQHNANVGVAEKCSEFVCSNVATDSPHAIQLTRLFYWFNVVNVFSNSRLSWWLYRAQHKTGRRVIKALGERSWHSVDILTALYVGQRRSRARETSQLLGLD